MGGEGACTWRVYTQTHTQLHLFIKEYCTVLHGYCNSRLEIEICRCTILYATERDCLAMTQCKRIAGIFGANGGRNASATLLLCSPLIFSFLPLPSSATQSWWRLPGSARSNTSSRLSSVAVHPGSGSSGPVVRDEAVPRLQQPIVQNRYLQEYSQSISNTFFFSFFFFFRQFLIQSQYLFFFLFFFGKTLHL